jgi:hypothetical protein
LSDAVAFAVVVLSCAVGVTAHVALVWRLAFVAPRWRALLALVCPPLAPIWGVHARLFVRSAIWLAAWTAYGVLRLRA